MTLYSLPEASDHLLASAAGPALPVVPSLKGHFPFIFFLSFSPF